ncbi:hypothetical protein [Goodfellowiella coeruleoviolacea]|uniref:Uncharacterized protein n=1 Tax=Goodfellowiella coeruleoviolacea TaxID=334858 RepID=A0AAE3GIW4_9PSEU|nr:hypothetical protein [Goodfellowiella coeruleoviolacea]MCP2166963.1 hypothetical protein [Goodfellowiella coeruleoviolacea]
MSKGSSANAGARSHKAGLFDLRWIITLLFAVYGVTLVVTGIGFTSEADIARAGGININTWSGVGMLLLAAFFAVWSLMRPLRVPDEPAETPTNGATGAGER